GQIGIAPSRGVDWSVYDLMMSQLSATVEFFRRLGVRAEVNHLAFEPAILDMLPPAPATDVEVSFVGTVSPDHQQRIALLDSVDDCLAAIDRALGDAESRATIARAGQARTMAQHTYRHRVSEILGFIEQIQAGR